MRPYRSEMPEADALKQLYDGAITSHGFDPSMRDYRIEVKRWIESEEGAPYTYRFTHCVFVEVASRLSPQTWVESWSTPTDLAGWEQSESGGFAWGVGWANVEKASVVTGSDRARAWARQVGHDMQEAVIETQVYRLTLVYFELVVSPRR